MFEISEFGSPFDGAHLRVACLIGETGKVYTYDTSKDAGSQMTDVVSEPQFLQATKLAKSLGHVEWQPRSVADDIGIIRWIMSFDGKTTLLQVAGDYGGALPDPRPLSGQVESQGFPKA
jgi:hypothetical protein